MGSLLEDVKRTIAGGLGFCLRRGGFSIGVDLGSALTKFVVLQHIGTHYILKDWWMEPVPPPDEIKKKDFDSRVIEWNTLPVKWLKSGRWPSALGVSISGPRVIVKKLDFPSMSEADIREHLKWELDRYISLEMGEVFWDLHLPIHSSPDSSHRTQVLLVVAQKEWIEAVFSGVKRYGLELAFVDVDVFALTNMITANYGPQEGWLLTHLGPSGMLLALIHDGEVAWQREIPFGVEWYGDLVDQIRTAHEQACKDPKIELSAQILLDPFLEEVTAQIQDAIRDCADLEGRQCFGGVVLSGGYSVVRGMDNKLSQKLGLFVSCVNPFKHIEVPVSISQDPTFINAAPLLGVAVGVALRGAVKG